MNSRERQLAAIRHEPTDRISVDVITIDDPAAIASHLQIESSEVMQRLGIDGRLMSAPYVGKLREPEGGVTFTEWGTPDTGDYGTARSYPFTSSTTIAEVEKFPWPEVKDYDFNAAAETARALAPDYAVRGPYWKPLFCCACDLFGMEEAMIKMATERAVFEAVVDRAFHHAAEFYVRMLDACGDHLHILWLGDDFATQRGLMFSPTDWRRFFKARYAKLFAIAKQRGKFVWFHSCGDITAVLPDLIDIGLDVWETVQLHALPLSPAELKREYGKYLTFFGAINSQCLPFATPAAVRQEVESCIEMLGRNGGYICAPDHQIKPDVPAANVVALYDTARAFRRPGYTRD